MEDMCVLVCNKYADGVFVVSYAKPQMHRLWHSHGSHMVVGWRPIDHMDQIWVQNRDPKSGFGPEKPKSGIWTLCHSDARTCIDHRERRYTYSTRYSNHMKQEKMGSR